MNSNSSVVFDSCRAAAYEYHCLLKKVGSSGERVGGGVGVWWVEECGRTCTAATQPQRRAACALTCCCGKKVGSSEEGSAEEWGDGGRRSAGELALLPHNRSAEPTEHTHAAAEQQIGWQHAQNSDPTRIRSDDDPLLESDPSDTARVVRSEPHASNSSCCISRSWHVPSQALLQALLRICFKRRGMITADADWFTQLGACFHPFCPPSAVQLCCVVNGRIR